jgi:FAD/FMN-containing dehydrogenase
MKRRELLKTALALPLSGAISRALASVPAQPKAGTARVRPGDPEWPSSAQWDQLKRDVGGRLLKLESPFANCSNSSGDAHCAELLKHIHEPFYIADEPALTQSSGWVDAWTSQPSAYAVAAENTADVVAAVNFARKHNLRLVVRGPGHGYQGTSCAPDSLLIWTRHMDKVTLHDAFVAQGCKAKQAPQPAATIESGAMWIDAYDAVTTKGGRYVQGGVCTTVGVAGLVQSGGFGSYSKNYGTAAAGLLEAEVVTADGKVRVANACTNSDLFWGLKGGGGGSLGVITRLTLRTRDLPQFFGLVSGQIKARSDDAYRALIARMIDLYQSDLFNPHWGDITDFQLENSLQLNVTFQGLTAAQAHATWDPFFEWVRGRKEYDFAAEPQIVAIPAQHHWDAEFLRRFANGFVVSDDREGAPRHHIRLGGTGSEACGFINGYKSAWLPAALLHGDRQAQLTDAMFACTRHWSVALHFNKGLAGAPAEEIAAARNTATNPQLLDAFALAILGSCSPPAYPAMPGPGPNLTFARFAADRIGKAMDELLKVAPGAGAYVSESDYFQPNWQEAFWGANYPKLAAVKRKYDPYGLFIVHHGVGSEAWSADGFTRV